MIEITLENWRSFRRLDSLAIKPLTILLGRNSSGKSSLARLLPLLRQSIETNTREPILWYSDEVDFGSFNTAVYSRTKLREKSITLGFRGSLSSLAPSISKAWKKTVIEDNEHDYIGFKSVFEIDPNTLSKSGDISEGECFLSKFILEMGPHKLRFIFDSKGILKEFSVDEHKANTELQISCEKGEIFPELHTDGRPLNFWPEFGARKRSEIFQYTEDLRKLFAVEANRYQKNESARPPSKASADRFVASVQEMPTFIIFPFEAMAEVASEELMISKSNALEMVTSRAFRQLIIKRNAVTILDMLGDVFRDIISSTTYVGPGRSSLERYTRFKGLAVNRVNADGANLAHILDSVLDPASFTAFQEWLEKRLNIKLAKSRQTGHIEIKIGRSFEGKDSSYTTFHNVADVGYGYFQILPILLQVFLVTFPPEQARRRRKSFEEGLLVIEQPEVHLHPSLQNELGFAMALTASNTEKIRFSKKTKKQKRCNLLVETHSDHFIAGVGDAVASGRIAREDVCIVLVENVEGESQVRYSQFDKDGVLENFPLDFFLNEKSYRRFL